MKYRFKRGCRKGLPKDLKRKTLRFKGRDTLRKKAPLPEPIEAIRLDDDKKRSLRLLAALKRFIYLIGAFFERLFSELRAAGLKFTDLIKKLGRLTTGFISKRLAARRVKKIDSLPILFGGALSSFLVCALTASYVIFVLMLPYSKNYRSVKIPDLKGMLLEDIDLDVDTFNLVIQYENNPDVEDGRIISQAPAAGITRKIYESGGFCTLSLKVSRHESPTVPTGITGKPLRDATLSLLQGGLSYTVKEIHSDAKKGTVIDCSPAEGASISSGDGVILTVSAGNKEIYTTVPSLTGLTESEALLRIKNASLSIGEVTYVSSEKKVGTVISQAPSPYTTETQGQDVSFTVSAGAEFSVPVVPDLYGMTVEQAKEKLYSVGLTVSSVYSVASGAKAQTVISQAPIAGTPITSSITSVELHISN